MMVDLWRKVRSGAYVYVKRGAVNWATFPFQKYKRCVSIVQDEVSLLKSEGRREAAVTFEIMSLIPVKAVDDPTKDIIEINDVLEDEMIFDAERVLLHLSQAESKIEPGMKVTAKVVTEDSEATEVHDPDIGVQGIVIPFTIGF